MVRRKGEQNATAMSMPFDEGGWEEIVVNSESLENENRTNDPSLNPTTTRCGPCF
jgi:hypothetical protein